MFNHARTLLLNLSGADSPGPDFPGEEAVPEDFRPTRIVGPAVTVRRMLFGNSPDRAMLNYRLRQCLSFLHTTELEEYVLALDNRVTYWPSGKKDLFLSEPGVTVTPVGSTTQALYVQGSSDDDSVNGRLLSSWVVEVSDASTVAIHRETDPVSQTSSPYTSSDGLSSQVALPGSGLYCSFVPNIGSSWSIRSLARPKIELGSVAVSLRDVLSEEDLTALFGQPLVEPYRTFRNLWLGHDWLPYSLGGLILALVYRLDAQRGAQ